VLFFTAVSHGFSFWMWIKPWNVCIQCFSAWLGILHTSVSIWFSEGRGNFFTTLDLAIETSIKITNAVYSFIWHNEWKWVSQLLMLEARHNEKNKSFPQRPLESTHFLAQRNLRMLLYSGKFLSMFINVEPFLKPKLLFF